MKPQLNFIYLHSEQMGYGYHGAETFRALQKLGVDVYDGLPGSGDLELSNKRSKICKHVVFLTTPTHVTGWHAEQHPHLFTMWEGTELPPLMRDTLRHFETILTPSQHCVDLYSRYHDNVRYVPLGVDSSRWHFQERREDVFFNFLVAGSGLRKGVDLVHRAFMELFDGKQFDGPIPRLIMKNPNGEQYSGLEVQVIGGYLPPEDEVDLYASAHCFVAPSRGEGWGMQPLQAIAQGLPTILTDAHGHKAFARHGLGIDATLVSAGAMDMFGEAGMWWEPDYKQLKAAMLHVYENYAYHSMRASFQSAVVRDEFTWEQSASAILDAIGVDKLFERFRYPFPPYKWVTPDAQLYPVRVKRKWRADVGGVTHQLDTDTDYMLQADVKRVLFEHDALDLTCGTDGLTPTQIGRLIGAGPMTRSEAG